MIQRSELLSFALCFIRKLVVGAYIHAYAHYIYRHVYMYIIYIYTYVKMIGTLYCYVL